MTLFFTILLGTSALFFTLEPLFRWRKAASSPSESKLSDTYADLLAEKEGLYTALKEIEFDHTIGKLSPEDYLDLKRQYEEKAVTLLQRLDAFSPEQHWEEEIEREIAAFRQQTPREDIDTPLPALRCPQCENTSPLGARFCAQCGAPLPGFCPACGVPFHQEDRFCAHCGHQL